MTTDHVEFYRRNDGKWSWRVKAANGRTIEAPGQGFKTRWGAKRSVRRVRPDLAV